MPLSRADHLRITQAIAAAEQETSGEIFCVLAGQASHYRDVCLAWAVGAAFLIPMLLIPLGFDPTWFPGLSDSWEAVHLAASDQTIGQALSVFVVVQAAILVSTYSLLRIPVLTRLVTPRSVRRDRVRQAAMNQFLAHSLHVTEQRTGVLIFAAFAEHQIEVIADQGIQSRVDETVWAEAVFTLSAALKEGRPADGFEQAVAQVGRVLAEHFPPRPRNLNEVPDRLIEI